MAPKITNAPLTLGTGRAKDHHLSAFVGPPAQDPHRRQGVDLGAIIKNGTLTQDAAGTRGFARLFTQVNRSCMYGSFVDTVSGLAGEFPGVLLLLLLCIADLRSPTLSLPALRWGSPATLTYFTLESGGLPLGHTDRF